MNSNRQWDSDSAEALMQSYEADKSFVADPLERLAAAGKGIDSLGSRYAEVSQRIKRTLGELQSPGVAAKIEERLDQLHTYLQNALENMARRSDLESLALVESHITGLGQKIEHLEQQMSRLSALDADVRATLEQAPDSRIAKLADVDFRAESEASVLRHKEICELIRSASRDRLDEETDRNETLSFRHVELRRLIESFVQDRQGREAERVDAEARRHDELRQLIEASIHERRVTEAHTLSLMTTLKGGVTDQADRCAELKALMESSIDEHRQSEQTLFVVLDTLQQAMVGMLDRIDTMEAERASSERPQTARTLPAASEIASGAQVPVPAPAAESSASRPVRVSAAPITIPLNDPISEPAAPQPDAMIATARPALEPQRAVLAMRSEPDVPLPAFALSSPLDVAEPPAEDVEISFVEQARRDFVAEARRAKLKASATHAEALSVPEDPIRLDGVGPAAASLLNRFSLAQANHRPPLSSTTLLAGILALVVAINGALLIASRRGVPAVPAGQDITTSSVVKGAALDEPPPPAPDRPANGPDEAIPASQSAAADGGSEDGGREQLLAHFSDALGTMAANGTGDLSRIPASPADPAPQGQTDGPATVASLGLPPATVGPLSLRVAAAEGDPSAQFEVGARLAEGKGTSQDYKQALHWYQHSAAKGFAQSQYRLGTLYERGLGVDADAGRAKIWYQRAADNGNVKAMHNLAVLAAGEPKPDYALASQWFEKAAEYGLGDSQFNLGVLYENGLGVKADKVAAYKWYALAAKSGDKDAGERLAGLKTSLPAADLKRGEDLVAGFRARPANLIANDARAAGEDWKRRANNDTNG